MAGAVFGMVSYVKDDFFFCHFLRSKNKGSFYNSFHKDASWDHLLYHDMKVNCRNIGSHPLWSETLYELSPGLLFIGKYSIINHQLIVSHIFCFSFLNLTIVKHKANSHFSVSRSKYNTPSSQVIFLAVSDDVLWIKVIK